MEGKIIVNIILFIVSLNYINGSPVDSYSIALEESLRTELLSDYSSEQRPEKTVRIAVSLTILTVNELNIKDQALSMSGYLTLDWQDDRLIWSNASATTQDYTGINFLFATQSKLWRPTVIIENAVDGLSTISDDDIPMRVTQSGRVVWNPVGIYKVSCESDTRYYPMDTQICYLKVSSWAYTSAEAELKFKIDDSVDMTFYTENGEWNLLSVTESTVETRTRDGNSFSSLSFKIKLQRRLLFHIVNTLFPVALMAILIAFVFKLSVESGEKIGFSLTVLLSYAVYLTLISDNIPSTSTTVCFLSLYLAFILLLATVSVCCSTFVINLYMRHDDDRIPAWVKHCTHAYLMTLACWENGTKYNKVDVADAESNAPTVKGRRLSASLRRKGSKKKGKYRNGELPLPSPEENNCDLTWKQLSEIMDKVFYNVYMFLIILSTFIMFIIIVIGYATQGA